MPGLVRLLATATIVALAPTAAEAQEAASWGVTFPTSQRGPAQAHFVEGVVSMHLHMFEDAEEHFRAAQRAAPGFAMAYWGEALSQHRTIWSIHRLEAARDALRRLGATASERAAKAPTDREKRYLAAVEALFGDGPQRERESAYSVLMRDLSEAYPDDVEATAWYALSLMRITPPGMTREQTRSLMASLSLRVLTANPLHPGANRYLIQSTDDPENSALGFVAVENLRGIEATAAEAIHIPSHVYVQQGMWSAVADANMRAFEASMAWVDEHAWSLEDLNAHNYGHLIQFAHYGFVQSGQLARAADVRERVRSDYVASGGAPELGAPFSDTQARAVVDLERWEEAADLAALAGRHELRDPGLWLAIGIAAARSGNTSLAHRAYAVLDDAGGPPEGLAAVSALQVAGLVHLADGDTAGGLALLREAADVNWDRPVTRIGVPPRPLKPTLELYGEALLGVGRAEEALEQFRRGLTVFRGRTNLLLGAARAARQLGLDAVAAEYYGALAHTWAQADLDHPLGAEVRSGSGS